MKKHVSCKTFEDRQLQLGRIFVEVNKLVTAGNDCHSILDFLFDSIKPVIPFDRIGIAQIEDNNIVRAVWAKSIFPIRHLTPGYSAFLQKSSLNKVVQSGRPRIINDLTEYLRQNPNSLSTQLILRDGIRSSLTCPLIKNARAVGFVFFSSAAKDTYADEHIYSFRAIADNISILLEQEKLREFFNQGLDRERTLRTIIHDLKAPLGIIQGCLDELETENSGLDLSDDSKMIFNMLKRNSEFMGALLEDLQQIHLHKNLSLDLSDTDLSMFCDEVTQTGIALAKRKQISFIARIDDRLPENIRVDAGKLKRAVHNLITNAIKFSFSGSEIVFSVESKADRLVFTVRDEGQGIKSEELPNLFREFARTSTKPTSGETSTGLGLSIVKRIVEMHGGEVSVRSEPNRGTEFSFWIPK